MAAPSKQASRWGSFLSQAVAGVEARLDNILAEPEGDASAQQIEAKVTTPPTSAAGTSPASPVKPSPGMSYASLLTSRVASYR